MRRNGKNVSIKTVNINDHPEFIRFLEMAKQVKSSPGFVPALFGNTDPLYLRKYLHLNGETINEVFHSPLAKAIYDHYKNVKDKTQRLAAICEFPLYRLSTYFVAHTLYKPESSPRPSIELIALLQYDNLFTTYTDLPLEELREKYPELTANYDDKVPIEMWRGLNIWPLIEADIKRWGDLSEAEKEKAVLGAYAVSSLACTYWPLKQILAVSDEVEILLGRSADELDEDYRREHPELNPDEPGKGGDTCAPVKTRTGADTRGVLTSPPEDGAGHVNPPTPITEETVSEEYTFDQWTTCLSEILDLAQEHETEPSLAAAIELAQKSTLALQIATYFDGQPVKKIREQVARITSLINMASVGENEIPYLTKIWEAGFIDGTITDDDILQIENLVTELLSDLKNDALGLGELRREKFGLGEIPQNVVAKFQYDKKLREIDSKIAVAEENMRSTTELIKFILRRENVRSSSDDNDDNGPGLEFPSSVDREGNGCDLVAADLEPVDAGKLPQRLDTGSVAPIEAETEASPELKDTPDVEDLGDNASGSQQSPAAVLDYPEEEPAGKTVAQPIIQRPAGRPQKTTKVTPEPELVDKSVDEIPDHSLLSSAGLAVKIIGEKQFLGESVNTLITCLIAEKQYSAAWPAAALLRLHGGTPPVHENLIKALCLAPHINYSDGQFATAISYQMRKLVGPNGKLLISDLAEDHHVASFFLAAACIRPALIAPQTNAGVIMPELRLAGECDGVYNLLMAIHEFANYHQPLDMHILKNSLTLASWKSEFDKVLESANRWVEDEDGQSRKIKYVPGKKIWRSWAETDGFVHRAVSLVLSGDISKLPQIKNELKRLSDTSRVDAEIDRTDDLLRPAKNSSSSSALDSSRVPIHNNVASACALLRQFISVAENKPGGEKRNFTDHLVNTLRDKFLNHIDPARHCLSSIVQGDRTLLGVSARACLAAIDDVALFFDPKAPAEFAEPVPRHKLYRHSLFVPGWQTDEEWQPVLSDSKDDNVLVKAADNFLASIVSGHEALEDAFEAAFAAKNHTVTERIMEFFMAQGGSDFAENYRARIKTDIADCRRKLRSKIDTVLTQASEAFSYGCIADTVYNEITGRLTSVQNTLDQITDFSAYNQELAGIKDKIAEMTKAQSASITKKFDSLGLDPSSNMYKVIIRNIEAGDYAMAGEMLQRALEGEEIPEEDTTPDIFYEFSTKRISQIEKYLDKNKPIATISGSLKANMVENSNRSFTSGLKSAEIFETYHHAGRRGQFTNADDITNALRAIGFEVTNFSKVANTNYYSLQTVPITSRSICPIAMYGSRANGSYRVIPLYASVYEDLIINEIVKAKEGSPIIVAVFGNFPEARRRKLAKELRSRAKTVLVIDNIVVYAAITSEMAALPALFRLAIPWTYYKPYSEGGGAIPVEMFYGREAEMSGIVGSGENTTAFIYGGRQLGKTALLNMVAKQFHNGNNHIAIYIDMLALGIGTVLRLDHIWSVLAKEFKAHRILRETDTAGREGRELDLVQQWLNEDESRQIILFLDEADHFLNEDGKDYFKITGRLKNLKDVTQGRFRLVFAGLHNVKRTTRAKNDPLVQLGTASCIGPMLSTVERHDAARLIEEPMRACGYYFESRELIWKIMMMALYSPSLIQIFCSKLMNYINSNLPLYDKQSIAAPPYIIHEKDVLEAYRTQDIRADIVYRINKTLTLDERYQVVANIIALDMLESQGKRSSYDASWLRQQAQKYWPKGFDQYTGSLDQFNVLLDEMVGLGVLLVRDGGYAFRATNMSSMLGSFDEILERLYKERTEPPAYTPEIFRPSLDKNHPLMCSPLSVTELGNICSSENGVFVVLGVPAGGILGLKKSVTAFGQNKIVLLSEITKTNDFETALIEELKKKAKPGTNIIYVDSTNRWDDSWIEFACKKVEKKSSENFFYKVVFEGHTANVDFLVQQIGRAHV